ncbi:protein arginine kinase [Clostridium rectalis]|uniref:protein arginine kinase n=1 Tax=Clostridium rectalis TaxID=2040295 RepID=UPI001FAAAA9C|nr:protein arginine kinase [Clostridium rectalis]
MNNWVNNTGSNEDIVLSSRIRLARNLKDIAFPHKLSKEDGKKVIDRLENVFVKYPIKGQNFKTYRLWELDSLESKVCIDRHLISNKLLINNDKAAFILNDDETISIMINEEDHLRVQCITAGIQLDEAYNWATKIDDILENQEEFAFNEKLGYLTACPTNIGTGLRASIMIHLPAVTMTNKINSVLNVITQIGMTIRGLFGEGSKTVGNIYQISNQVTLGLNENEIITNLKGVVNKIISQEKLERQRLIGNYKYELEDKIYRALGILKSAILLGGIECLNLLSDVRLGIEMGLIEDVNKQDINGLIVDVQPAMIQKNYGGELSDREISIKRAQLVREKLNFIQ